MPWHACKGVEDSFVGSDLSFHLYVGSGDQAQFTQRVPQEHLPAEPSLPPESFSLVWVFSCALASKISLCALKVLVSDRFTDVVEAVLSFLLVFSVTYFLSIWVSQALPTVDFWFNSTVFREF